MVLGLLLSGNAFAKNHAEVIFQNDQLIIFKSKRALIFYSDKKYKREVNEIMSISKMHCNRNNKDAYWFNGLTSGQGGWKAGVEMVDNDDRDKKYVMYRVICASSVNEAIKNFRQKISLYNSGTKVGYFGPEISMYNSELSKRPKSVYKNDISSWSSDIKLKSSDFNEAKDNSNDIKLKSSDLNEAKDNSSISSTNISPNIRQKKEQCKVIGFKPETEKFADCVLRLLELDIKQ